MHISTSIFIGLLFVILSKCIYLCDVPFFNIYKQGRRPLLALLRFVCNLYERIDLHTFTSLTYRFDNGYVPTVNHCEFTKRIVSLYFNVKRIQQLFESYSRKIVLVLLFSVVFWIVNMATKKVNKNIKRVKKFFYKTKHILFNCCRKLGSNRLL